MTPAKFEIEVGKAFKAVFPNGYIHVGKVFTGDLCIQMCMTGDLADVPHRIRENDTMRMTFTFHGMQYTSQDDITDKIEMEPYYSSICTIPVSQYYAMGHEKIKTRKTTNTPEKLLATIKKYINAAGVQVLALKEKNEIYQQDQIKSKYFEINVK